MAKLTIDIPDELVSQVKSTGYPIEAVLLKALTQYLANNLVSKSITETRTWQLCGHFTVSKNTDVTEITNYAEQVDDVLYQGL
ncbi:MAG: hypothetical protein ACFCUV_16900 [Rivularia sp. (in: cyanobacteria)]